MTIKLTGKQIIGGVDYGEGNITFSSVNPRTNGRNLSNLAMRLGTEIDLAVSEAVKAYKITKGIQQYAWQNFWTGLQMKLMLWEINCWGTADSETGLGIPRLSGERGRTTGQLRKLAICYVRVLSWKRLLIQRSQSENLPDFQFGGCWYRLAQRPCSLPVIFPLPLP